MRRALGGATLRAAIIGWAAAAAALSGCASSSSSRGPLVETPPACIDFDISIYFEAGSARLTREAADLLRVAATRSKGCSVSMVDVIGLADTPGDPDANLQLSKQRANAVTRALARQGFRIVSFDVAAAGDAGAQTPLGQSRPLRRRADVRFHVTPRS
jgi:outer membrane protein OmpA-like peptidoglycan-associated protein